MSFLAHFNPLQLQAVDDKIQQTMEFFRSLHIFLVLLQKMPWELFWVFVIFLFAAFTANRSTMEPCLKIQFFGQVMLAYDARGGDVVHAAKYPMTFDHE